MTADTTTDLTLLGYRNGDRVRDVRTDTAGTVRIWHLSPADAADCGYEIAGEVRWDGSFVDDELELAIGNGLRRI
jgi:hypothetical protein